MYLHFRCLQSTSHRYIFSYTFVQTAFVDSTRRHKIIEYWKIELYNKYIRAQKK